MPVHIISLLESDNRMHQIVATLTKKKSDFIWTGLQTLFATILKSGIQPYQAQF